MGSADRRQLQTEIDRASQQLADIASEKLAVHLQKLFEAQLQPLISLVAQLQQRTVQLEAELRRQSWNALLTERHRLSRDNPGLLDEHSQFFKGVAVIAAELEAKGVPPTIAINQAVEMYPGLAAACHTNDDTANPPLKC